MRTVLIAGGAGHIGAGIVHSFLQSGYRVAVPSRNPDSLANLPAHPSFVPIEANVIDDAEAIKSQIGALDALVVSVGGWFQGPSLLDLDLQTWHAQIGKILTTHFLIAKAYLPALAANGQNPSATFIGGSASEYPVSGAGVTSVAGAAQIMLALALALEASTGPVRINELILGPVATSRVTNPDPTWTTPGDVGNVCVELADPKCRTRGQVIHLLDRNADWLQAPRR